MLLLQQQEMLAAAAASPKWHGMSTGLELSWFAKEIMILINKQLLNPDKINYKPKKWLLITF